MKNFDKLFSGLLLAFGLMCLASRLQATSAVVSPKNTFELSYTTTVSTVTPVISTFTTASNPNAAFQPGAVFEIFQSSGASGDYFQMFDSSSTVGITCGQFASFPGSAGMLGPRFLFGSTSAETVTKLDPPLEFFNGLVVCVSSTADQASVSYELGRGLSGD